MKSVGPKTTFQNMCEPPVPRLRLERDAEQRLTASWDNPPEPGQPLDAAALREMALALLDAASAMDRDGESVTDAH